MAKHRREKEPRSKAGKLIKKVQTEKPRCAKPIPGGRCTKVQGHWGKCG